MCTNSACANPFAFGVCMSAPVTVRECVQACVNALGTTEAHARSPCSRSRIVGRRRHVSGRRHSECRCFQDVFKAMDTNNDGRLDRRVAVVPSHRLLAFPHARGCSGAAASW
jgi:hypothetical protein